MAISPPSDILLDVASAADPLKVQAATARLARLAADPSASTEDFGKALASARTGTPSGSSPSKVTQSLSTPLSGGPTITRQATHGKDVYQKFEAVLLQSFVESMLPKNDELYGNKNSAAAYRSMMAEQIASQIAKAGGIGIAKAVQKSHPGSAHADLTQGVATGGKV